MMKNRLSKWSIIYFFTRHLLKQIVFILIIFCSVFQKNNPIINCYAFIFLLILKIVRGVYMWASTWFVFNNSSIIIKKGFFFTKTIEIFYKNIHGAKIRQNAFYRVLGVFDLKISVKGNGTDLEDVLLSCIPDKYKNEIMQKLSIISDEKEENNINTWCISEKKIILASFSSITWTYLLSLAFIKSDIEEYLIYLPHANFLIESIENLWNEIPIIIIFLIVYSIGVLLALINNFLRFFNYKVCIRDDKINISRGLFEKLQTSMSINGISSFAIISSIVSELFGYGKLIAEGQEDDNDELEFVIFPYERKKNINLYLYQWFNIQNKNLCKMKKPILKQWVDSLLITFLIATVIIFIQSLKNKLIFFVLIIYICTKLQIKNFFDYISINENVFLIHKAGLKNKTSYIFLSDVVGIDVESNFIQRKLGLANITINIILNNCEQSFSIRDLMQNDIDKLIYIWRINHG